MKKDKYEISVWEDVAVAAEYDSEGSITKPAYFKEQKIGVIGADGMTAQTRAIAPALTCNVNGTSTLTFQLYYSYIDNETGESVTNPWVSLLVNERKVKVLWKDKWYDMVVKSIVESSDKHTITYTCKDAFINELSKNGFNLEFDGELQNNTGTINELATAILEGTDWKLGDPVVLNQTIEEPVYETTFVTAAIFDGVEIAIGAPVLVYYSVVANREPYCQFWYDSTGVYTTESTNQLVLNGACYGEDEIHWEEGTETQNNATRSYIAAYKKEQLLFKVFEENGVSDRYRAERLVRKQKTVVDSKLDRTVNVYRKDGVEYYGYSETEYKDPTFVNNIVAGGENFSSTTSSWSGEGLRFVLYPDWTKEENLNPNYFATSHMELLAQTYYLNRGVKNNSVYLPDGFQLGDKWVLRYKVRGDGTDGPRADYVHPTISAHIGFYKEADKKDDDTITVYSPDGDSYLTPIDNSQKSDGDWTEITYECVKAITKSEITTATRFNFLFRNENEENEENEDNAIWLEKIEFFPYVEGAVYEEQENLTSFAANTKYYEYNEGVYLETEDLAPNSKKTYYIKSVTRINPGELDKQSIAQMYYKYYSPAQNYSGEDDIIYEYCGTEQQSDYTPYYGTDDNEYEKIRTITGKESNRFNLIQNLCETFECWAEFHTEHDQETGQIKYNDKGCPNKTVTFREEIGDRTGLGFIYGIDLKTIQRTINSDQIVSKTIVKSNSNEFAENGFCTIARAQDNYCKESFILDFGYYISQGLLSSGQLTKDLYMTTADSIGYYYWLHQYNTQYDANAKQLSAKNTELVKQNGFLTTYSELLNSTDTELAKLEDTIISYASAADLTEALKYAKDNPEYTALKTAVQTRFDTIQNRKTTAAMVSSLEVGVAAIEAEIASLEAQQEALTEKINAKHKQFWNKYSAYIQEGVWTSEDYVDDELYYLDACSVAYTSARPQTSYSISVLRLSALEEFQAKVFRLGDICYIQDPDFFGYTYINSVKTPYKEEVFVSEITSYFDTPDKDTFKVQNYKTQFEDLFQRITATTQSLQYASGSYAKAAAAVDSTGTLTYETLQNAFARNENIVQSAQNETIYQDSTGITLVNANNPSQMLKLTSIGILLSVDGGETWTTGVSGTGISTEMLTTGAINTDIITVLNKGVPQYRWDANGITAYWMDSGRSMWLNKFIRFDQNGLYGVSGFSLKKDQTTLVFKDENKIWNNAATKFALTWKGFLLRNTLGDGSIEINSETNQISVTQDGKQRIALGKIGNNQYGMQLRNAANEITLETNDEGNLWLRNKLSVGTLKNGENQVTIGQIGIETTDIAIDQKVFGENTSGVGRVFTAKGTKDGDTSTNLVIYEDGTLYANGAIINGTINASGGTIGNLEVAELPNTLGIRIQAANGDTFKLTNGTTAPTTLSFTVKTSLSGAKTPVWRLSSSMDFSGSVSKSADQYDVAYDDTTAALLKANNICYLQASVEAADRKTYTDVVSIKLVSDGIDGKDGASGKSSYSFILYAEDDKGTSASMTPSSSLPFIGVYVGETEITKDNYKQNLDKFTWSKYLGEDGQPGKDGQPGAQGPAGADGSNGVSSYTYILYSKNADGSNPSISSDGMSYIGIWTTTNYYEDARPHYASFTWSKFVGADGQSSYTFIRYTELPNGEGSKIYTEPNANTKYIGVCTKSENVAPEGFDGYEWSKYVGDDGVAGKDGASAPEVIAQYSADGTNWHSTYDASKDQYIHLSYDNGKTYGPTIKIVGTDGQDGTSYYTHIRYCASLDDDNFWAEIAKDDGTKYIGIWTGTSASAPIDKNAYTWSKYVGSDAPEVLAKYRETNDVTDFPNGWHNTYQSGDQYICLSYDGGTNWSDPIKIVGENGKDANQYMIVTNQEEILKFAKDRDGESLSYSFSPQYLEISLADVKHNESILSTDKYDLAIYYNEQSIIDALGDLASKYIDDDNSVQVIDDADNTTAALKYSYFFRIQQIYEDVVSRTLTSPVIISFINALKAQDQCSFEIVATITENGVETDRAVKWINCKIGFSDEMAKFSLNANGINAAIQNAGLEFTANGLRVSNGRFEVGTKENIEGVEVFTPKLSFDGNNLSISGATYTGKIIADSGEIGGFSILENELSAKDNNGLRLVARDEERDGQGRIYAPNIEIGTGAEIKDYIEIGNLRLQNPSFYKNKAIVTYETNFVLFEGDSFKNNVDYYVKDETGNYVLSEDKVVDPEKIYYEAIRRENLVIRDTGEVTVGGTAKIQGIGDDGDVYWQLDKDLAIFNNGLFKGTVTASEINASTITTEVFKTLQTQAMGGAFIFRPSTRDIEIQESENANSAIRKCIITFRDEDFTASITPKENDLVLFQQATNTNKLIGRVAETPKIWNTEDGSNQIAIEFFGGDVKEGKFEQDNIGALIYLGQSNSYVAFKGDSFERDVNYYIVDEFGNYMPSSDTEVDPDKTYYEKIKSNSVISIDSEDCGGGTESFMSSRALSMTDVSYVDGKLVASPRLVLGDLSEVVGLVKAGERDSNAGYGLYADNVYLNGRLVAKSSNGTNAGINSASTIYETEMHKDDGVISDPVVLWAGASSYDSEGIQAASFRVTRDGYLYANKGKFANGIFTDATISASTLKAAKMEGIGAGPSLVIYDTNTAKGGVQFKIKGETEDSDVSTLAITSTGFYAPAYNVINEKGEIVSKQFIALNDSAVTFSGNSFSTAGITVDANQIAADSLTVLFDTEEKEIAICENLVVKERLVRSAASQTQMENNVRFGVENSVQLSYEKDDNEGYSLYVN